MSIHRWLAGLVVGSLCATPAFAIQGLVGLSDGAGSIYGQPAYQACDTSAGAAPGDGVIHYDSATATSFCGFGGAIPGFNVSFDVFYGPGVPAGITGVTSVLYHITFTNFSLVNNSTQNVGPGDTGFFFSAGSAADFPDGLAKTVGLILAGTADDNAGDGSVSVQLIGSGGIDTGGAANSLPLTVSGSVAPGGSLAFFAADPTGGTYGLQGFSLGATLYITAPAGDGLTLPGSFDVLAMGPGYTFEPVVVPVPAAGWLLATGVGVVGTLARRRRGAAAAR